MRRSVRTPIADSTQSGEFQGRHNGSPKGQKLRGCLRMTPCSPSLLIRIFTTGETNVVTTTPKTRACLQQDASRGVPHRHIAWQGHQATPMSRFPVMLTGRNRRGDSASRRTASAGTTKIGPRPDAQHSGRRRSGLSRHFFDQGMRRSPVIAAALMTALRVHEPSMPQESLFLLFDLAMASAIAFVAALAYYPGRSRTTFWLICFTIVAFTPCLITPTAKPLRFLAALIAIDLLVKLYDVRLNLRISLWQYFVYLSNIFWLVHRRKPSRIPRITDLQRLVFMTPAAILSIASFIYLFQLNWLAVPFALEHVLKVIAVVLATILMVNTGAIVYRLLGGVAIDPMNNPMIALTPADFWRRWNRPVYQFFQEYIFNPAGGVKRLVFATLFTFFISGIVHEYVFGIAAGSVQGGQLSFFMVQGFAVVATMRIRPKGRTKILWITGTLAFNLSTSVLFFYSVNQIFPFYVPR